MTHKGLVLIGFIGIIFGFVVFGGFLLFTKTVFFFADKEEAFCINERVEQAQSEVVTEFVDYKEYGGLNGKQPRLIAFYLPPVGIAALTGGRNRIAKALELLNKGVGDRLLISGVREGTTLGVLSSRDDIILKNSQPVELGYEAVDTVGNAKEVLSWAERYGMDKIAVVTSFYHIPRSFLEFYHKMPRQNLCFFAANSSGVVRHWWRSFKSFRFLMMEYVKFLAVYVQYRMLGL